MRTKKAIFFLFVFLSYVPVLAQVDTAWVRRYNGPGNYYDVASAVAVDDSGNVFVTGVSFGSGTTLDYATVKYAPNGDSLWVRRYNGPGNGEDVAYALAVDDSGNVFVTGTSYGDFTSWDYATIKYAPNGDTLWVRRYNGPGNGYDYAFALAIDGSGNVYGTGYSSGSGTYNDYATIKYAPNGDTLWVRRYNGPGNGNDQASALAVDGSGNVYVTGWSYGSGTSSDYATIKYSSDGDTLWVKRYNGPGNSDDFPYGLTVDDSGNVYATGHSIGLDSYDDYATIKYTPLGDTAWVRRYNGTNNYKDGANALAVDDSGNVYVTGFSEGLGTSNDYLTIKYTSLGDTVWVRRYNGPSNGDDAAFSLVVDGNGNVYVTGESGIYPNLDYLTIKYSSVGQSVWAESYNGPASDEELARDIAIDESGNVYVTGTSVGSGTSNDYATVKYVQFSCSAKPGDANTDNKILLSDIVTIINFLFKFQPAPNPSCRADANADGSVLLTDIVYLINFIFKSGPAPQKSRECCL